jgi:hypothetical protein
MEPSQIGAMIPIVAIIAGAAIAIFAPLARAHARQVDRSAGSAVPPEVAGRLERIEQAVDAIAIEVERISEGQRFTTQLLSEGRHQATALPAGAEKAGPAAPRG